MIVNIFTDVCIAFRLNIIIKKRRDIQIPPVWEAYVELDIMAREIRLEILENFACVESVISRDPIIGTERIAKVRVAFEKA